MNKHITKPQYKKLWNLLAPENIELGQPYSLTINLKDSCDNIKDDYKHYLYIISLLVKPYSEFCFNFELSCVGKLHIHGEIIFHSYTNVGQFYYKFGQLKNRMACELDTIENLGVWQDYCNKQNNVMGNGLLPYNGMISNKEMTESHYVSPKVRDNVMDGAFQETHLDD